MKTRLIKLLAICSISLLSACDRAATPDIAAVDQSEPKLILVTGATGTQGGAVTRELLKRGYAVRALTRDPGGARAQALLDLGAQPVKGDFNDAESIASAMNGVYGVFAVTLFWTAGYEGEVNQGKLMIDEATKAGVEHFVLTSVAGADESTGVPHFDSKWEVEQYLHQSELSWSIVRPVEFMDNWYGSVERYQAGLLVDPRQADSSHQWIAASDIGFFVGEAFDNPESWTGRTEEIAGDQLTVGEFATLLSEAFGNDVVHQQIAWDEYEALAGEEITTMVRWFETDGYSVDVAALRESYPELVSARAFLTSLAESASSQQESD